jgi:cytochrome c-type biogenesis protein CcmH/NrfG
MTDEPQDKPTPEPPPCRPTYSPGVVAAGALGLIAVVIALAAWGRHGAPQATKEPEVNWRALYDLEQANAKRIAAIEKRLGMDQQP